MSEKAKTPKQISATKKDKAHLFKKSKPEKVGHPEKTSQRCLSALRVLHPPLISWTEE